MIISPATSHLIFLMFMPEISNRIVFVNGKHPVTKYFIIFILFILFFGRGGGRGVRRGGSLGVVHGPGISVFGLPLFLQAEKSRKNELV